MFITSTMPQETLYSKTDHKRVSNLFTVQVAFMTAMAQIPPKFQKFLPHSLAMVGRVLSGCYCVFMAFLTFHLAVLYAKTTFDSLFTGKLEDITDPLTLTIIYSFSCFATCYWLVRSAALEKFLEGINRNYRHHSLAGLTYVSAFQSYSVARRLTLYWMFFCLLGTMLWALTPIILQSRTLPLKCWYPFDQMAPVVYEAVYLSQLLGQINVGATFGNGSALYVSLITVMLGQFDVLFCSLKNFTYYARFLAGEDPQSMQTLQDSLEIDNFDELNQYQFAKEHKTNLQIFVSQKEQSDYSSDERKQISLRSSLRECVLHHQFVLESCAKVEELFNPYCLIKSIQITFQLCLLVFVGVAGERSLARTINLLQYLALTSCELLMFTYFGELLRTHSMRAGEALMRAPWFIDMTLIRQDILIFLANTKRPVKLTAGKFFIMDVQRLRSVVAQAFSFLTLLQNLAAKN